LAPSTVAAAAVPLKHHKAERAARAAAAARRPRRPFRSPVAAAARGTVVRRRQGTNRRRRPDAAAAARPTAIVGGSFCGRRGAVTKPLLPASNVAPSNAARAIASLSRRCQYDTATWLLSSIEPAVVRF